MVLADCSFQLTDLTRARNTARIIPASFTQNREKPPEEVAGIYKITRVRVHVN